MSSSNDYGISVLHQWFLHTPAKASGPHVKSNTKVSIILIMIYEEFLNIVKWKKQAKEEPLLASTSDQAFNTLFLVLNDRVGKKKKRPANIGDSEDFPSGAKLFHSETSYRVVPSQHIFAKPSKAPPTALVSKKTVSKSTSEHLGVQGSVAASIQNGACSWQAASKSHELLETTYPVNSRPASSSAGVAEPDTKQAVTQCSFQIPDPNKDALVLACNLVAKRAFHRECIGNGGFKLHCLALKDNLEALAQEVNCLYWANGLMDLAYGFINDSLQKPGVYLRGPLPCLRMVHAALAMPQGETKEAYLLEEHIDDPFVNLSAVQHIQYNCTGGQAILTDFQGSGDLLPDPQVLTAHELFGLPYAAVISISAMSTAEGFGLSRLCKSHLEKLFLASSSQSFAMGPNSNIWAF
ncbi:hypothetical protein CONPUDRAFT_70151 [Coniophora puteana RWD-64-598 SS2]|uniref:Alpha-type protein kinase domain-containing protein n=1 Tax=Coniophora puteana (strain RWD-64-598) TaxID=741705 RepID=A0A5M3N2R3_CONPW|nr:uncharacterized protein CONPUDRAFT_70151 [Coniophora puteana RWD-64-598 SS2]EIW85314.1 hypothetical protein CONPUDRAFT_70151 [Coniophora puteana RWD-64-598 SS2]